MQWSHVEMRILYMHIRNNEHFLSVVVVFNNIQ